MSGDFRALGGSEVNSYAQAMMDSRIALVPRGTVAESYRLFEAWRYGCIATREQLPPRPFLLGAPAITLRSWRELEPVLDSLLAIRERQQSLHAASLAWWRDVCSRDGGRPPACRRARAPVMTTARPPASCSLADAFPWPARHGYRIRLNQFVIKALADAGSLDLFAVARAGTDFASPPADIPVARWRAAVAPGRPVTRRRSPAR